MPTLSRVLISILEASITVGILLAISNRVRQSGPLKHIVFALFLTTYLTCFILNQLVISITYLILVVVLLNLIYRLDSFTSAFSIIVLYLIQTVSGLMTVNLYGVLKGEVFDFRTPYIYLDSVIITLYILCLMVIILFYRTIVFNFKSQPTYTRGSEEIIATSNFIMALVFVIYLKGHLIYISGKIGQFNKLNTYLFFQLSLVLLMIVITFYLVNKFILKKINMEKFRYKAEIDPLTGALSRDAGMRQLKAAMRQAYNNDDDLTIGYVDINNLKTVNDKYGHAEGDIMIKRVTDVVKDNLRDHDAVSRIGGDEFMVIFRKCNDAQAMKVWRRISDAFIKLNLKENFKYTIGASGGFTQYDSSKHKTVKAFMEEADAEMYKNKKQIKAKQNSL